MTENVCQKLSIVSAQSAIVYQSELDFVSRCILDYPNIETGGQLFGFWTASGVPVVLFAIGPGAKANHQVAFFNQDIAYLTQVGNLLVQKFGLQHIGEWHSHHQLELARPSGHDIATMVNCIGRQHLGRFLLCIGNCTTAATTFNAYIFTEEGGSEFTHAFWDVKSGESPFRTRVAQDKELTSVVLEPSTPEASHSSIKILNHSEVFSPPEYACSYWLEKKENNAVLKGIVDHLAGEADDGRCKVQLDSCGLVHLSLENSGRSVRIVFPLAFPANPPMMFINGNPVVCDEVKWHVEKDLCEAFLMYCGQVLSRETKEDTDG